MAAPEPDIEKLQALSAQMERKLNDGSLTYEIWRGSRGFDIAAVQGRPMPLRGAGLIRLRFMNEPRDAFPN